MKKPIKKLTKKQDGGIQLPPEDSTLGYYPKGSMPLTTEENLSRREAFKQNLADYYVPSKRVQGSMNTFKTAKNILDAGFGQSGFGRAGRVALASDYTGLPKAAIINQYPTGMGKILRAVGNVALEPFDGCLPGAKPGSCVAPGSRKKGGEIKTSKKKK